MFPQLHHFRRRRSQNKYIRQTRSEHGDDGNQRRPAILLLQKSRVAGMVSCRYSITGYCDQSLAGPCESESEGEDGLEAEVRGKNGLL